MRDIRTTETTRQYHVRDSSTLDRDTGREYACWHTGRADSKRILFFSGHDERDEPSDHAVDTLGEGLRVRPGAHAVVPCPVLVDADGAVAVDAHVVPETLHFLYGQVGLETRNITRGFPCVAQGVPGKNETCTWRSTSAK